MECVVWGEGVSSCGGCDCDGVIGVDGGASWEDDAGYKPVFCTVCGRGYAGYGFSPVEAEVVKFCG